MEVDALARASVVRVFPDAREDTWVALYALLVVVPVGLFVSRWLLARGDRTTPLQVILAAFAVPAVLLGLPLVYDWFYGDMGVYRMLLLRRTQPTHVWARKYSQWRRMFKAGDMPPEVWSSIDRAYDEIYDEQARAVYDFWGPGMRDATLLETQCNVAIFYVVWAMVIYALTTPRATQRASNWAFSALLAMFGLELSVRLLHYDPVREKGILPFLTPRDIVQWAHRLFPIVIATILSIKRVFYIDMDVHQNALMHHLLQKNRKTEEKLGVIADELHHDERAEADATTNN